MLNFTSFWVNLWVPRVLETLYFFYCITCRFQISILLSHILFCFKNWRLDFSERVLWDWPIEWMTVNCATSTTGGIPSAEIFPWLRKYGEMCEWPVLIWHEVGLSLTWRLLWSNVKFPKSYKRIWRTSFMQLWKMTKQN